MFSKNLCKSRCTGIVYNLCVSKIELGCILLYNNFYKNDVQTTNPKTGRAASNHLCFKSFCFACIFSSLGVRKLIWPGKLTPPLNLQLCVDLGLPPPSSREMGRAGSGSPTPPSINGLPGSALLK